jgi:flagellar hook-associated protein 1 FlgK
MSLASALSIALSGLTTSTNLISLASDNISNAQTQGYTAKTVTLQNVEFGNQAGGVQIASYTRATDQALTNNFNSSTSQSSYYDTQSSYMTQVQTILNSSSTNPAISSDISQFAAAWNQYAADPSNPVQQQNVISAGRTLAGDISTAATAVGTLNTQVKSDITNDLTTLNSELNKVATINTEIQNASTSGQSQTVADLQDQLDDAVNTISTFTTVSIQQRPNGQIAIYTPSGQPLADGPFASQYSYDGTKITNSSNIDVTSVFTGGSIQAALQFVDTTPASAGSTTPGVGVIVKLQSQLSKLVDAFTGTTGSPASAFAAAYTNAYNVNTTGVAPTFFTVSVDGAGNPDPTTFDVTGSLLNGTANLPSTNTQTVGAPAGLIAAVAATFTSTTNYTASGLTATSATYAQLGSAVLSTFQQTANAVKTQSTAASSLQSQYKTQLANETGVNLDQELANLTAYQNSYAASAHVISTVNSMYNDLLAILS